MSADARAVKRGAAATALLLMAVLLGWVVVAAPATQQKAGAAAAPSSKAEYVGTDTCKTCHEDQFKSFEISAHYRTLLDRRGGPAHQGCEACHGPGSEHVNSGGQTPVPFDFAKLSARAISERCLDCHRTGHEQMNFFASQHARNAVTCTDCHSIHHAGENKFLLVKDQPQLCFTCHREVQPSFRMPFHHRVLEGMVRCTDCHNPHGTFFPKQLRTAAAGDQVCFTCHVDKQGPFVFEHEPVKTEGCTACHTPHGSPNPHLLRVANVNQLCLQCHTVSSFSGAPGTPSFHNQAAKYQACTLCHTQIHGSNVNQFFFQ